MNSYVDSMEWTGERLVPGHSDDGTFWEHIARYQFAALHVSDRAVLDIACGEGYGTFALSQVDGANVIGVDVCPVTCEHARRKYGFETRCGSAEKIPVEDKSVEVVVSFETIEHVTEPMVFIKEIVRVMTPDGILVISSPNRDVYRRYTPSNEFHCSEMSYEEFVFLLRSHFAEVEVLAQENATRPSPRGLLALTARFVSRLPLVWRVSRILMKQSINFPNHPKSAEEVSRLILKGESCIPVAMQPLKIRPECECKIDKVKYLVCICRRPKV